MTKKIAEQDNQQETLLSDVLAVLKKNSLTFSEKGVHSILSYIKKYQSNLRVPIQPTKSEIRKQIKSTRDAAQELSAQIDKLLNYPVWLDDNAYSWPLRLNYIAICCNCFLTHYKSWKPPHEGRPAKAHDLKLFVQMLILLFEKETGEGYVLKEFSLGNRERALYHPLAQKFVKSILKFVAPEQDAEEILKAVVRPPMPLVRARKVQRKFEQDNEDF